MKAKRERYTPHDVGPSPLEWDAPYLKDVSSLITNGFVGTATPYYTDEKGVPYLYGTNVRANKIDSKGIRYINQEFHAKQEKTKLQKGDLLTVQSGHIGETAVVPDEFDGANCHALIVTRTKNKYVFPDFLSYYINSEIGKARLKGLEVGSTILHINTKDLKKFRVLLPPLPEQRKIAKILSTWDKAISTTERLIDNSKQQKKALMQQLLTGKKRLLDDSGKPFEGEWEDLYLHDVAKIIVSPVDKKIVDGEIPVELCNYTDVYYNTRITNSIEFMKATAKKSEIDKYTLQVNDVIITKDSETPGDIAVPALVSEDLGGTVCGYHLAIVRPNSQLVEGAYLNYLFSMQKTRYYFFTLATGATRFGLSIGGINKAHFTLPPLEEQRRIAAVLTNSDREVELLEQQLADLKQEKKALMQQLLTGKRRVKVDEEAMA
ncbi:restriction endonuclease subunit S [Alteromonas macleodii]|jgi:type I restriction enzyme S subunit|uniref:restriction endonuclease subunit S n=1 Tax=Alteromonas macleodii TaxID=28108 RepID=UPI001930C8CC|nr:restriction endonuclease subunit S [Alteromonas macleodii]